MKRFDDWFKELTSDTRWVELLRHYKDDTIKKAGEKVFAGLVADGTTDVRPMSENRKHVYNTLIKQGAGDKPKPKPFSQIQAEEKEAEKEKEWVPVSEDERGKRLKEWAELVKRATITSAIPRISYKELAEEGGVLPPKPAPYPCTSKEELYVRQRHFEYIKNNFEARTGQKLPTWICEEDWNIQYDNLNL